MKQKIVSKVIATVGPRMSEIRPPESRTSFTLSFFKKLFFISSFGIALSSSASFIMFNTRLTLAGNFTPRTCKLIIICIYKKRGHIFLMT